MLETMHLDTMCLDFVNKGNIKVAVLIFLTGSIGTV